MTHIMKIDEMAQSMFYYWNISKATEDWEVLEIVASSEDDEKSFRTADAAYNAGLRELKRNYKDGVFMLEVHYENLDRFPKQDSINYENGYIALSVNGKVQEV